MEKPPEFLSRVAAEEWGRMLPALRYLGELNRYQLVILAAYCQQYGRWVDASRQAEDSLVEEENGKMVPNPLNKIADAALKKMLEFAKELGLRVSPSDESIRRKTDAAKRILARRSGEPDGSLDPRGDGGAGTGDDDPDDSDE